MKIILTLTAAFLFMTLCMTTSKADGDETPGMYIDMTSYGYLSVNYHEEDGNHFNAGEDDLDIHIYNYYYNLGDRLPRGTTMFYRQENTDGSICTATMPLDIGSEQSHRAHLSCTSSGTKYSKKVTLTFHLPPTGDASAGPVNRERGYFYTQVHNVKHKWYFDAVVKNPTCTLNITPKTIDLGTVYVDELRKVSHGADLKNLTGQTTINTQCNDTEIGLAFKTTTPLDDGCMSSTNKSLEFCLGTKDRNLDLKSGFDELQIHGDGVSTISTPLAVTAKRGAGSVTAGTESAIVEVIASPE
ncbi:hypothetical protein UXN93_21070 [Enterobacter hormaechei]